MWTNSVIGQSANQEKEKEATEQKNISYGNSSSSNIINSNSRSNSLGNAQRFRRKKKRLGGGRSAVVVTGASAPAVVVHAMEEAEQE